MSQPLSQEDLDREKVRRAKRRIQAAAYRAIHLIVIFYAFTATAVAILAAISFWDWQTLVFAIEAAISVLILILSIVDDVYAYSVTLMLTVVATGWNTYILIVDCATFYKILPALFNPGYIPADCHEPYCEGYRADTFWAFYLLLALLALLGFGAISVYAQLFAAEADASTAVKRSTSAIVTNYAVAAAQQQQQRQQQQQQRKRI